MVNNERRKIVEKVDYRVINDGEKHDELISIFFEMADFYDKELRPGLRRVKLWGILGMVLPFSFIRQRQEKEYDKNTIAISVFLHKLVREKYPLYKIHNREMQAEIWDEVRKQARQWGEFKEKYRGSRFILEWAGEEKQ